MRHFYLLLAAVALAVALTLPAHAATTTISALPAITSPSTNTWIEVADMAAATKSRKYLLTNLATVAQVPTLPTNMVVSAGASTAGAVATYVGTDGTNQAPSSVLIVGNTNVTVPGQLGFTGTTHSGLTLNNLTTAQRDALTGSNTNAGSVIWNTTTGRRNTQNGSEWTDGYVDGELQFGPKTTWLVFEGDSFTSGYAPFLLYPYPYALTNSVLTNSWIVPKTNCAVSGETIVQMQAEYAAEVAPFKPDGSHDSLLFIFAGINDAAADSGATMFANISNYWAQAKADGFQIVAFTLPHQNGSVQGRVNVMDFNRYVRAAYTNNCYDFLVDYARLVPIANEVSAGDNFHPGNQLSAYLAYTIGDILRQRRGILNFEELQPSFSGNMLDLTSYNNSAYRGFPYTARISGFSPGLLFEDLTTSDAVLINPSDSGAANFYRHSGTGDVTVADMRISLTTNVVINTHLTPSTNNVFDFGSSANRWATGYFQTGLWVGPSSYLTDFGLGLKAGGVIYWTGRSDISSPADGVVLFTDTATTSFGRIQLGGTTAAFPAIKRNGTNINFRLADDSADAGITASASTLTGNQDFTLQSAAPSDSATNFIVNFDYGSTLYSATNDVFIKWTTNRLAGRLKSTTFLIDPNGADRNLSYAALSWKTNSTSAINAVVTNGTLGMLSFSCWGANETNVTVSYRVFIP